MFSGRSRQFFVFHKRLYVLQAVRNVAGTRAEYSSLCIVDSVYCRFNLPFNLVAASPMGLFILQKFVFLQGFLRLEIMLRFGRILGRDAELGSVYTENLIF